VEVALAAAATEAVRESAAASAATETRDTLPRPVGARSGGGCLGVYSFCRVQNKAVKAVYVGGWCSFRSRGYRTRGGRQGTRSGMLYSCIHYDPSFLCSLC